MKVTVMGRSLRGRLSGVVRYTTELIRGLAPRADLTVLLTQASDGLDGLPIRTIRAPFPTPNSCSRIVWEQLVVPITVGRLRPQLYHSPNYILPIGLRCPTVVTVHDVDVFNRSYHRFLSHLYLATLTLLALRKATRVICVSAHTRSQLAERFPWASSKLRVIPEGVGHRFAPQSRKVVTEFRRRQGLADPYVLFVGTVEPRKNLARLIRAFGTAVERAGTSHRLVIAGGHGWKATDIRAAYESSTARHRIHFMGYLPDAELPAAYSGADIFAFPSLAEGFGLPALEAMACGTAVVSSNAGALRELVGDAALLVDPLDEEALACGLARCMVSPVERETAVQAGLKRASTFRWDRVAEETLAVYREVA